MAKLVMDAQLVEAAPELLKVLREAWEYLDCIPESAAGGDDEARAIAERAYVAIKKAGGFDRE